MNQGRQGDHNLVVVVAQGMHGARWAPGARAARAVSELGTGFGGTWLRLCERSFVRMAVFGRLDIAADW